MAPSRHLGNAHRHLCVVAVLARGVVPETAAEHARLVICGERRLRLIRDAEGVATRLGEKHAGGSVVVNRIEVHTAPPASSSGFSSGCVLSPRDVVGAGSTDWPRATPSV